VSTVLKVTEITKLVSDINIMNERENPSAESRLMYGACPAIDAVDANRQQPEDE
jgi:hypothetical protein